jgi:hypothetical protein
MKLSSKKLKTLEIPEDITSYGDCMMRCGDKTIMQFFLQSVAEGTSPKMAEALAMQQSPGIGITNAIFQQDQNRHGRSILDRMNGDARAVERLRKQLAAQGYTLKSDDHYIPTCAARPGDVNALVTNTNSHESVQRYADRLSAEQAKPKPKVRLHPRIVNRIAEAKIQKDPSLAMKPRAELAASIVEEHGGSAKD